MFSTILGWMLNAVYGLVLCMASPLLLWRSWRTGRYRRGWPAKLLGNAPQLDHENVDGRVIWLHAVSVGEVNLLAVIIERLERQLPGCRCVVSTTTDTGYQVAMEKYGPRPVFYCPLDFTWAVHRAMRRIRPDLFVLAELELWPNLITAARRSGAKVAIINARLSQRSAAGYQRIGWFMRRLFSQIDLISAQTDEYGDRFRQLGADESRVTVTGSVKFDGACGDRQNGRTMQLADWAGYRADDLLWVVGSTQAPEEQLALQAYVELRKQFPRLRLALVPRHPERRDEVLSYIQGCGLTFVCRSEAALKRASHASPATASVDSVWHREADARDVLLVDVVGELGAWWGRADIAYVGGSMGSRGGQNMIEPAAFGCPTSFGPNTKNFRDVVSMLLSADAAVVVRDGDEMAAFVRRCIEQPRWAEELGARARSLVVQQQGAADRTCTLLTTLLEEPRGVNRAA